MITIENLSPRQAQIAEILWNCQTEQECDNFINGLPDVFRRDAVVVKEMIIAAAFDDAEFDFESTAEYLKKFS